nr:putative copia-like polyprotein [Tanacetum cinerariifolium]
MSNIEKIKFPALDTNEQIIYNGRDMLKGISNNGCFSNDTRGQQCTEETKAKADVFLHQHIDEMLESEYSSCDDPSTLWKDLEIKFNNQREVLLPSARDEWNNLRFQDFKKKNNDVGTSQNTEGTCFKCGSSNHWSKACHTPSHLCELYQASRKGKEKEVNHVDQFDNTNTKKFKMSLNGAQYQAKDGDLCIADSGATHTIVKSKKYFFELKPTKGTINTISGPINLVNRVGKANVVLPNGTQLLIENALFSLKSKRNIYHNGYDTQSRTIGNKKYLLMMDENQAFDRLLMLHSGLHYTHFNVPQAHMAVKENIMTLKTIGSKDKNPHKRKGTEKNSDHDKNVHDETQDIKTSPEEEMNDINKEMSINYSQTNILWDRNEIGDIDEIFYYYVASDIMSGDHDPKPKSKTTSGFLIIAVYIDDLNIIGTNKEINEVVMHLKEEFEMKDLGKTKYCLGLQIEHMPNDICVHQSNYTEMVLKRFNMDKAKFLSTPMVGRSLNVDNDPFRPCKQGEDVLGPEVPYLSAIGALMYLTNCTTPDISFVVNLLARFSSSPIKRQWNGIKHIF